MPTTGMEPITVPGAFDGWVTLLDKYGTMKLAELLAPAIDYAENGFPVMEKTAADWVPEVAKPQADAGSGGDLSGQRRRAEAGDIFHQKNLARTLRTLARGGRDAFYRGEIARAIVDYCRKNGGFLSLEDFAAHKSEWVEPISTTYRGHTLYEMPPNGQGLTALHPRSTSSKASTWHRLRTRPGRYYHTLIEATKLAFADRNRYIADPAFAKVPVPELLSKDYAAGRRGVDRSGQGARPSGARRAPRWAATPPTSPSSTRTATPCRSSTASSPPSDPAWSPATPASCCRTAAPASRSIPDIPIASSRASGRSTR